MEKIIPDLAHEWEAFVCVNGRFTTTAAWKDMQQRYSIGRFRLERAQVLTEAEFLGSVDYIRLSHRYWVCIDRAALDECNDDGLVASRQDCACFYQARRRAVLGKLLNRKVVPKGQRAHS